MTLMMNSQINDKKHLHLEYQSQSLVKVSFYIHSPRSYSASVPSVWAVFYSNIAYRATSYRDKCRCWSRARSPTRSAPACWQYRTRQARERGGNTIPHRSPLQVQEIPRDILKNRCYTAIPSKEWLFYCPASCTTRKERGEHSQYARMDRRPSKSRRHYEKDTHGQGR